MAPVSKYDWEAAELDFQRGMTVSQVSRKHGFPDHSLVSRHMKKNGVVQGKLPEVLSKTKEALLAESARGHGETRTTATSVTAFTREEVIEAAVRTNVEVVIGHRSDIRLARNLFLTLATQLQEACDNRAELEKAIEEDTVQDATAVRRAKMLKAIALPAHAAMLRDLSTTLKNIIPLERQAFGLEDQPPDPDAPDCIEMGDYRSPDAPAVPARA